MAKASITKEDVIEFVSNMSVLELSELVTLLKGPPGRRPKKKPSLM
jgi:ribosomal protein L7/L12